MDYFPIFSAGQQVICIKSSIKYSSPPIKGRVYTVHREPAENGMYWVVVKYNEDLEEFLERDFTLYEESVSKESKLLIAKAWADAMGIEL